MKVGNGLAQPPKKGIPTIAQAQWGLSPRHVPEPHQSQPHLAKQEFSCCIPAMSKDKDCSLF